MKRLINSGYFLAIAGALGFSSKSILTKLAFSYGVDAMTLLIMRIFIALPFFLAALFWVEGKKAFKVRAADLLLFAFMGIAGLGCAMLLSFYSLELIEASVSTLVVCTYPAMTVIMLAVIARERFPLSNFASLAITFAGLALIVKIDGVSAMNSNHMGVLFALGAAFFAAVYSVLTQKAMKEVSPIRVITYCMFFLAVFLGVFFGRRPYPVEPELWGIVSMLAIFTGFISFICSIYSIKKIGAGRSVMVSSIAPVFTVIWAFLFLGESLDTVQLAGMALVVLGVVAVKLKNPVRVVFGRGDDFKARLEETVNNGNSRKRKIAFIYMPGAREVED